jgi:hypothetical protein
MKTINILNTTMETINMVYRNNINKGSWCTMDAMLWIIIKDGVSAHWAGTMSKI